MSDQNSSTTSRSSPPVVGATPGAGAAEAQASPKSGEIGSMLAQLALKDDEDFDDFELHEDDVEIKWLAVARVVCPKKFSHEAFFQQMRHAWNSVSAQGIKIRAIGENRFIIQCFCLTDWEKVTQKGPWLFRGWAVAIAPYDGFSDADAVTLDFLQVWLQVHKLPEGYRKEAIVKELVGRVAGKVETVEMNPAPAVGRRGFRGDYVRVRVNHDVTSPLTRFVSISRDGKRSLYAVKYEKIGRVCYACGIVGHGSKECGTGICEEKDFKYGDWIYATPPNRNRGRGAPAFRGSWRGARTNGRGRGNADDDTFGHGRAGYVDWRLDPERDSRDKGLDDTTSSPIKSKDTVMMTDTGQKSSKKLGPFPPGANKPTMTASQSHRNRALLEVRHPWEGYFVYELNLDNLFSGEPGEEFPRILNLPDPVAGFKPRSENMFITVSGNLIVAATSKSRTLLYDTDSRSASTGPDMLSGKTAILLVPMADGMLFAMSFFPYLDPKGTPHAELLAKDAGGRLAWHPVPDPPLQSSPSPGGKKEWRISAYFVAGTRVWVSFLHEGTFSFDTVCRQWRMEGFWQLPVRGLALLIPDVLDGGQKLLFGFSSVDLHFCACDILEARPPVIIRSWPEAIPSQLARRAGYFEDRSTATLAYYGAGRFCISTVIVTGYFPQKFRNMNEVLNLPRHAVSVVALEVTPELQLIKHKLDCYSMPAEASVGDCHLV